MADVLERGNGEPMVSYVARLKQEIRRLREENERLCADRDTWRGLARATEEQFDQARFDGREEAELECIKAVCPECSGGDTPEYHCVRTPPWWHMMDPCSATAIHELRRKREEQADGAE